MKYCLGVFLFAWMALSHAALAQFRIDPAIQAEALAQTEAAMAEQHAYLNAIGYAYLAQRAETVAAISSRAEAEARQAEVREQILALVGGMPETSDPVAVQAFDTVEDDGFHIENIAYESVPGYWVTANVYVPMGEGPFPALVIAPGHGAGKSSQYSWAANFAAAGFVVLAIDPMGQGERMQHYDDELGTSKVEPSGEHEHANQSALLMGQHIARYWFADGVRGVDYLTQRADVAADRIGTFGCSGGGTAAAYLAAMDPRIRAAAVASFITSFKELLPGNGPQDAEQTLPNFIGSGLDFADWIEQAAPRPYAILAFEQDFFPYAGAEWTYEEANDFYAHFDAADQLQFIGGAGGHCNLGPVTPQLLDFLYTHLQPPGTPIPTFDRRSPEDSDLLLVTPTGQLSTSIGSATIEDMVRRDADAVIHEAAAFATAEALAQAQPEIRAEVRRVAAVVATEAEVPAATVVAEETADGYGLETWVFESEPGIEIEAVVGLPSEPGRRPLVLWMDATDNARTAASPDFTRLVKAGNIVVAFQPRGVLGEPPPNPDQLALGPYMPQLLRAIVVDKTLVGMRVDDTLRLLNILAARDDVDPAAITLYGSGGLGLVALHAAALDTRITKVVVENTLVSYRMALEAGLHKNLSESVVPGVLRHYDTVDLLHAIHPRSVTLVNPASAMGRRVRATLTREALAPVFETDQHLGTPGRIQVVRRGFRDPIPLE